MKPRVLNKAVKVKAKIQQSHRAKRLALLGKSFLPSILAACCRPRNEFKDFLQDANVGKVYMNEGVEILPM